MKYFTQEWWSSGGKSDKEAPTRYAAHLASIRAHLPASAMELDEQHTLHDSRVKHIVTDFERRQVTLMLLGWNQRLERRVRYVLKFADVSVFEQTFPKAERVGSELGDLGYWEWDLAGGESELRLLFASSATFRLMFKDFSFTHEAKR